MKRLYLVAGTAALAGLVWAQGGKSGKVDFLREVRPILSDNCFACHGPDAGTRMAEVRFDTKEGAFAKGPNGPLIVPGDAKASRLFIRVAHEKAAMKMPPAASGKTLTAAQVETLRKWIDEGAEWATHWSYAAPRRPELPAVSDEKWARNPIDRFVLARLDREGLKPRPEARKETLVRRVTLDLTGLPPTPEEVQAFVQDTRPGAYERLVDRLLASPHFGERMAMMWLDLARYADTHGYHIDSHRDMHHWREWVIGAFNRNLPFDEFTVWQIAGDLLPGATREQRLATGFNRNHMINFEGGAIPEEYLVEYVVDRVETTSTVWMGMTMGCARCHDHKYDPVKQKEFYEFFAFFNNVAEKGLDGRSGNAEPLLRLSTDQQEALWDEVTRALARREEQLSEKNMAPLVEKWERMEKPRLQAAPREGLEWHLDMDGHLADVSGNYQHGRVLRGEVTFAEGPVMRSAVFSGESQAEYAPAEFAARVFDARKPWTVAFWFRTGASPESSFLEAGPGWRIFQEKSEPIGDLRRGVKIAAELGGLYVRTKDWVWTTAKEAGSTWHHVAAVYDGSGGVKLFIDGAEAATEKRKDGMAGGPKGPLGTGDRALGQPYKGQLDDARIYSRTLAASEIRQLAVAEPVRAAFALEPEKEFAKRMREHRLRILDYYLKNGAGPELARAQQDLEALRAQRDRLVKQIPTVMVMSELEKPRETFVLGRGDYRNRTVKVEPGVPAMLPPLPKDAPRNRLGLARWLVSKEHPLTSRVAVNRFWQMLFGTGLVKTAEDFGSQGEAPSHPELLDWLAVEFIESGWDVKAMVKRIVMSAAYRQRSDAPEELVERDPENRLLARGPRFRMPAEMLRDQALAASGLLNAKIGGESVNPYQPPGVWEAISYGDVYSAQHYEQDHGDKLYRRSMYTFWKRTAPPPALAAFDAPDREKCVARRARTNTPLQALVLMNDPQFVEAARALALRAWKEGGAGVDGRLRRTFMLVTGRAPDAGEMRVLRELLRDQLAHYAARPKEAGELVTVGESAVPEEVNRTELAAWTMVASAVMNLDEAVTKE